MLIKQGTSTLRMLCGKTKNNAAAATAPTLPNRLKVVIQRSMYNFFVYRSETKKEPESAISSATIQEH